MTELAGIRVLPANVINKIAAGEVVERPSSVLKELLENAIDADATQVDVNIVAGGRKLIAVSDNGSGMNRDDAILSVERHATSKIRDVDDIENIATLGFRGEALAAIAAVSRFRLTTCLREAECGTEITITGGKIRDVRESGCPGGTSIEVRDLFFNVPARRKFLRSHQTELTHVRTGFITHALARPAVGMSLTVDGRNVHQLPADAGIEDRIRELFGPDYVPGLRLVDFRGGDVDVSGYVSLPALHRSDRGEQFVFVNGRSAGAPVLAHAIREGYHTLIPSGRHPSVFLSLRLDPDGVDVNVHPTKKEVRFRRSSRVRDAVIEGIRQALAADGEFEPGAVGTARMEHIDTHQAATHEELRIDDLPVARAFKYPRMPMLPGDAAEPPVSSGESDDHDAAAAGLPGAPWSWCRVLGQVGGLYVVLETEDGLVLMDPHAAHERVLFDRYMSAVLASRVETQSLLMPETVEMQPGDASRLRRNLDTLAQMGFGISEFGGDAFVVDALPAQLSSASAARLLPEIAQSLEQAGRRGAKGRWREETIAQSACKAAVKAHDALSLAEVEQLVVDLAQTEMPYTCPHGRPTLIFTSFGELNRKFGRE